MSEDLGTPTAEPAISDKGDPSDSESTGNGGIVDPSENAPKETAPDPLRSVKHKIKSNGVEKELDYDDLVKKAELADGAYEKFEKASKWESSAKKLEKLTNLSPDNIEDLLEVIPFETLLEISSKLEKSRVDLSKLTDEQLEDLLYRQEAEAAKAKLKKIDDDNASSQREKDSLQAFGIIEKEILGVIEEAKAQGIPLADLPDVGIEVVDELLSVLTLIEADEKAGRRYAGKVPTAKDVFQKIFSRYQDRTKTYLQKHSPDKLLEMLTPEQHQELRQASLDKLHGNFPKQGVANNTSEALGSPAPKRNTTDSYFKQLEAKYGAR